MNYNRWKQYLLIFFLIGYTIRLLFTTLNLTSLDRLFIPDDTYYTLAIARSIAEGIGPTVDGVVLTNGFQPLLAFILVPFAVVFKDPDLLLRIDIILLAFFDSLNIILIALLSKRLFVNNDSFLSLLAALFWAVSSTAIGNALGGLETSLAVFLTLLMIEFLYRARETSSNKKAIIAGICAGLALLARIDTAFIIGLLGLYEFFFGERRKILYTALTALIVVLPWWFYEIITFKTIIPESGPAVQMQAYIHQLLYLKVHQQVAWALGTVVDFLTGNWFVLRGYCFVYSKICSILFLCINAVLFFYLIKKLIVNDTNRIIYIFISSSLILCWFYIYKVPAIWFFLRYLAQVEVAALLIFIWIISVVTVRNSLSKKIFFYSSLIIFSTLIILGFIKSLLLLNIEPKFSVDYGLLGAKGYRNPALQILENAPKNAVIGAFQSGALSYYAPTVNKGIKIVNLDGVVDGNSAQALRERRLASYAKKRGVTHLADWEFNIHMFLRYAGDSRQYQICRVIAVAENQFPPNRITNDRFMLVEINWQ